MSDLNEFKEKKATTMEFNKLSVSIISVLMTVAVLLGGFCYQNGKTTNKIENLEKKSVSLKEDFRLEISEIKEKKAEKVVVELILKKIDENIDSQRNVNRDNQEQHQKIIEKLDRLIEGK